jgi:hypothetical protein
MKAISLSLLLLSGVATMASATEAARTFVQATILGSNAARGTLTFLDASGRQRVERATGDALSALAVVHPGDQAILSMSSADGAVVVTKVRVHRAEAAPAADGALGPAAMPAGSTPARRSWPNPYAKANRGGSDAAAH